MRTTIRGRNLTVTEEDSAYIERKLQRLERVLDDDSEAEVELRLEGQPQGRRQPRRRRGPARRRAHASVATRRLPPSGRPRTSSSTGSSAGPSSTSSDLAGRREAETVRFSGDAAGAPRQTGDDARAPSADESPVVKVKRFAIEPMFEEDAISRMEELGHTFFIFVNAENERVAVLYRRRDGRYGLIEPVIGGQLRGSRLRPRRGPQCRHPRAPVPMDHSAGACRQR